MGCLLQVGLDTEGWVGYRRSGWILQVGLDTAGCVVCCLLDHKSGYAVESQEMQNIPEFCMSDQS